MKKLILIFTAVISMLSFSACGWKVEIRNPTENNSELVIREEQENEIPDSEPERKLFTASFLKDYSIPAPEIFETEDFSVPKIVSASKTEMSGETYEIWNKYIDPLDKILLGEFDEKNPLKTGGATYTYLFYYCENLDFEYYGIEKSGCDMAESYLVDGRRTEESIARWFNWNPEDYREYFDYNPETDEYRIVCCGGGPTFTYVTDYRFEGDILTVEFDTYNGLDEADSYMILSSHEVKIRLEETGWKYLSARETENYFSPNWHSYDYSFGADFYEGWEGGKPGNITKYWLFGKGKKFDAKIYGMTTHKLYFGQKNICLFFTENGLYLYDFNEFYHVSELPSEYEGIHTVKNAWIDSDGNLIITYVKGTNAESEDFIELAVFDIETKEVKNYIHTLLPADYIESENTIGLKPEPLEGTVRIYDVVTGEYETIKYLE